MNKYTNQEFNERLDKYKNKKLRKEYIFNLGKPSKALIKAGFPELEIKLLQNVITKTVNKHHINIDSLKNLLSYIHKPIIVFNSSTRKDSKVILTEIQSVGGNVVVAVAVNYKRDNLKINDIKSIYGKPGELIINWINKGLVNYSDKKKAYKWISLTVLSDSGRTQSIIDLLI